MIISETANNVIGGIGGFVLAACLAPQLIRMIKTRSAFDLSYFFLGFYVIGLALTAFYMIVVNALVGYIFVIIETVLAAIMLMVKIYLDYWGPYAQVKGAKGPLDKLTISSKARLDFSRFLTGGAGAPFPMMTRERNHVAAHLLLDCQFDTDQQVSTAHIDSNTVVVDVENNNNNNKNKYDYGYKGSKEIELSLFADMLESCLEGAGGLKIYRRQSHAFASFKRRSATTTTTTTTATTSSSNVCFIPVMDGYVVATFISTSATLAVDFWGASEVAIEGMEKAAKDFCTQLTKEYAGTKIIASSVSRLPSLHVGTE